MNQQFTDPENAFNQSLDAASEEALELTREEAAMEHSHSSKETDEETHVETPKHRAKRLRKLKDDELLAIEDAAIQCAEMKNLALRKQADFDNYQKRVELQRQQDARFASSSLIRALLEPIDNLARALAGSAQSEDYVALQKGLELTFAQLLEALQKHGASPIDPEKEEFDPAYHDAVLTGVDEDFDDNVVLDTFEKGWKLHERVIRPAKVRVNKRN